MLLTPPRRKPQVRAADLELPALGPLGLKLVRGGPAWTAIEWPRVQKPGLAIAGSSPTWRARRVQILGESEFDYLRTLSPRVVKERFDPSHPWEMSVRDRHEGDPAAGRAQALLPERDVPLFATPRLTSTVIEGLNGFPGRIARTPRHAPRRPRRGRRARHTPLANSGLERASARWPSCNADTASSPTTWSSSSVPQRRPRRILGGCHPPPHGAAGPGHRQRAAPVRRRGRPRAAHRRARHPAFSLGPRGSSTTGSASDEENRDDPRRCTSLSVRDARGHRARRRPSWSEIRGPATTS